MDAAERFGLAVVPFDVTGEPSLVAEVRAPGGQRLGGEMAPVV